MNEVTLSETKESSLERDVKELVYKHKLFIEGDKLINDIIKYTFQYMGVDNKIKTEYVDSYCDLFIEYASKYPNANGFWGKYKIDEGVKHDWVDNHQRFKQTLAMIPNITANLMNENVEFLVKSASVKNDIKTSVQICLKLIDVVYRTDKDGGALKDRAKDYRDAKKRATQTLEEDDIASAEEFLDTL